MRLQRLEIITNSMVRIHLHNLKKQIGSWMVGRCDQTGKGILNTWRQNKRNELEFTKKIFFTAIKIIKFCENKLYLYSASFLHKYELSSMRPSIKISSIIKDKKSNQKFWKKRQLQKNQNFSDCRNPWYYQTYPRFCHASNKPPKVSVCFLIRPIFEWNTPKKCGIL